MASDHRDIGECAEGCREENVVGLDRSMKVRDSGVLNPGQIIDVLFADFIADPFAAVRKLYAALGRELSPVAEQRMRDFLAAHPGDRGGARYTWSDTGLDAGGGARAGQGLSGAVRRADGDAEVAGGSPLEQW